MICGIGKSIEETFLGLEVCGMKCLKWHLCKRHAAVSVKI